MKNVPVDATIIPQVLQYAIWAETNPDSVRALWLECQNKPDGLLPTWEDFDVRIIVIAPHILRSTLDSVKRINYEVDLIEVNRWVDGDNELLLVSKLEPDGRSRPKPTGGLETYDLEFYKKHFNADSAKEFFRFVGEVEELIKDSGCWKRSRTNTIVPSKRASSMLLECTGPAPNLSLSLRSCRRQQPTN